LDYLGRATNAKITIVTARNYEDMVHYFADGRVDFGTISPAPYVLTQQLNPGVKLLLTELSWDPTHTKRVDSYQGMIVTLRARNDINTLDDLRGKRMGFVSEESTSGFVSSPTPKPIQARSTWLRPASDRCTMSPASCSNS